MPISAILIGFAHSHHGQGKEVVFTPSPPPAHPRSDESHFDSRFLPSNFFRGNAEARNRTQTQTVVLSFVFSYKQAQTHKRKYHLNKNGTELGRNISSPLLGASSSSDWGGSLFCST